MGVDDFKPWARLTKNKKRWRLSYCIRPNHKAALTMEKGTLADALREACIITKLHPKQIAVQT